MSDDATQRAKALWSSGNYENVAAKFAPAGEKAVAAAEISSADRALDVACGTGNATLPAARTGAKVTGLDLTPALLEKARAAAADAGLEIEFVEGDAGDMPFEDASFDRVISVFGCMFVPDHRQGASELARVLGGGGRLAVLAWTPEGINGQMFTVCSNHMPAPPDGFQPPIRWGDEDHVREIFEGTGLDLDFERAKVLHRFDSVEALRSWIENDIPPAVASKAALEPEGKWEALRDDLFAHYEGASSSENGGLSFEAEYLVTKGSKA